MSERAEATLAITTTPGGEIEVFDHQFNPVARATDSWSGELPVGIYKVQFRTGGAVRNELVELEPGGSEVKSDIEAWTSAVPLTPNSPVFPMPPRTERQMSEGVQAWADTSRRAAAGASRALFCFVSSPSVQSRTDLGRAFSVLPFAEGGEPLEGTSTGDQSEKEGWAWKSYVDPPRYSRIKYFDGLREVEQIVPTLDGYCTAVFLRYDRSTTARWGIAPASTTVLMARLTDPVDEHRENHRYAELILRALDRGGRPVSESRASALCTDPMLDPLTRLYLAAHLISRWHFSRESERPAWALARAIDALTLLTLEAPDLPDVRLLSRWAQSEGAPASPGASVSNPPLLSFSWSVGIQAAIDDPQLIPSESLAISASLQRAAAGPWFAWRASPGLKAQTSTSQTLSKDDIVALVAEAVEPVRQPNSKFSFNLWSSVEDRPNPSPITTLEAAVVQSLVEGLQGDRTVGRDSIFPMSASPEERVLRYVSASFGLTANTVAQVVENTVRKLGET